MGHYSKWHNYTSDRLSEFARLRVDVAQTGFFEGREFRSFHELSIPALGDTVIRFTSPVPFILFGQDLTVDDGGVRLNAMAGSTSLGDWTPMPVIGKNRMPERRQPYYEAQATLDVGGWFDGGTVVETVRAYASGQGNSRMTVGGSIADERGLPAGVYHLHFENLTNVVASGVYSLWWEERPAGL